MSAKKGVTELRKEHGKEKLTFGQRCADVVAASTGSWIFIITFLALFSFWIILNTYVKEEPWDPFPFILLNLGLSLLAAIQAPIILMSQNRSAERDRHKADLDYNIDKKAEAEISNMQQDLNEIKSLLKRKARKKRKKK